MDTISIDRVGSASSLSGNAGGLNENNTSNDRQPGELPMRPVEDPYGIFTGPSNRLPDGNFFSGQVKGFTVARDVNNNPTSLNVTQMIATIRHPDERKRNVTPWETSYVIDFNELGKERGEKIIQALNESKVSKTGKRVRVGGNNIDDFSVKVEENFLKKIAHKLGLRKSSGARSDEIEHKTRQKFEAQLQKFARPPEPPVKKEERRADRLRRGPTETPPSERIRPASPLPGNAGGLNENNTSNDRQQGELPIRPVEDPYGLFSGPSQRLPEGIFFSGQVKNFEEVRDADNNLTSLNVTQMVATIRHPGERKQKVDSWESSYVIDFKELGKEQGEKIIRALNESQQSKTGKRVRVGGKNIGDFSVKVENNFLNEIAHKFGFRKSSGAQSEVQKKTPRKLQKEASRLPPSSQHQKPTTTASLRRTEGSFSATRLPGPEGITRSSSSVGSQGHQRR